MCQYYIVCSSGGLGGKVPNSLLSVVPTDFISCGFFTHVLCDSDFGTCQALSAGVLTQPVLRAPFSRQDLCFLFTRCWWRAVGVGGATNLTPPCVTLLCWGLLDHTGM